MTQTKTPPPACKTGEGRHEWITTEPQIINKQSQRRTALHVRSSEGSVRESGTVVKWEIQTKICRTKAEGLLRDRSVHLADRLAHAQKVP